MGKQKKPHQVEPKDELSNRIGEQAKRKLQHRGEARRSAWFGLGLFGLVGWSVALPTLIGIALGIWIDEKFGGERSWTLALLLAGIALGCANAWYWVKRESQDDQ